MTSTSIYSILSSKPHNPHYLNRYWKFIQYCQDINSNKSKEELGYTEKHHICPKAPDLFPEYKSFKDNKWNKILLTYPQHIVAHHMLWKSYGGSQLTAFNMMIYVDNCKIYNLKILTSVKIEASSSLSKRNKINNPKMFENGLHPFQDRTLIGELSVRNSIRLLEQAAINIHPFQNTEFIERNKQKLILRNEESIKNGTHNFQVIGLQQETQLKRIKDGTHQFLTMEHKEATSRRTTELNKIRASKGEYKTSQTNVLKTSRENVKILREFINKSNIKLGAGWYLKSDDWINNKIIELKEIR